MIYLHMTYVLSCTLTACVRQLQCFAIGTLSSECTIKSSCSRVGASPAFYTLLVRPARNPFARVRAQFDVCQLSHDSIDAFLL